MRALLSGWVKLVSSNVLAALLQLAVFALCAQVLELAVLGMLVLIQTWAKVVEGLVNFQSVNVLSRFFAEADEQRDSARLRGLVKAGLLVDGACALAAALVAIALVPLAGEWFGLPLEWHMPAQIYALVLLTRVYGVTEAALRCFDRFWLIGLRPVAVAALMLAATVAAWLLGAEPTSYLYGWLAAEALVNLAFIARTLMELHRLGVTGIAQADARASLAQCPSFWRMLWHTNATFSIRMLSQDADVLVASSILGPAGAALLRAAKNVAAIVSQLGRPLQQVAAGPLARFVVAGNRHAAWSYSRRIAIAAGFGGLSIALAAVFLGEFGLTLAFGEPFAAANPAMVLLLGNASLYMFGIVLLPFGIALGRSDIALSTTLLGTITFAVLLALLAKPFGLQGIAWAHIGYNAVWLLSGWAMVYSALFPQARRPWHRFSGAAK